MATIAFNVYLFIRVPKGFFPQQDNGRMMGSIQADQDTSFQAMDKMLLQMSTIVDADPAIDTVNGFTGGGSGAHQYRAHVYLAEAARGAQDSSADDIIGRLRPKLARIPGRHSISAAVAGPSRRRPRRAMRNINSRCAAITCRI